MFGDAMAGSGSDQRARRPRVAVVYPIPFGDDGHVGGGERYAQELARALSQQVPTRLILFGKQRRCFMMGRLRVEVFPWLILVSGSRINPFGVGFLRALVSVDVIHCISWHTLMTDCAIVFAKLTGKRIFVTHIGGMGRISLADRAGMARFVNGFLLLSQYSMKRFSSYKDKCHVIYGGATSLPLVTTQATESKVLFVGRLTPHKGVDALIEAIPPTIPLTIVGRVYNHGYYETLQELAVGKRVTFLTDADDDLLMHEYSSSTLLVHPSVYTWANGGWSDEPELFGLTVVEAMMHGLSVIVSDVASLPELVEDGKTGIVVPPRDVPALRAAIERLVTDRTLSRQMGLAGYQRAQELFTWQAVMRRCLSYYDGGNIGA